MALTATLVVAYDVGADGRRSRLAALLESWGDRIQYSVFMCSVSVERVDELVADIAQIIDPDEDSVYVVRQCRDCHGGLVALGQGDPPRRQIFWGVF